MKKLALILGFWCLSFASLGTSFAQNNTLCEGEYDVSTWNRCYGEKHFTDTITVSNIVHGKTYAHTFWAGETYCGTWKYGLPHGNSITYVFSWPGPPALGSSNTECGAYSELCFEYAGSCSTFSGDFRFFYIGDVWTSRSHGQGEVKFTDGVSFRGTIKAGIISGYGVRTEADGTKFIGNWKADGTDFKGEFDGKYAKATGRFTVIHSLWVKVYWPAFGRKKTGQGVIIRGNGDKIFANFDKDLVVGKATINSSFGGKYIGEVSAAFLAHGYGEAKFSNGGEYVGQWKNGERNGTGTFKFVDGTEITGAWENNILKSGEYVFTNGDRYVGEWKDWKQHGKGVQIYANGEQYSGVFQNGKRHGLGNLVGFLSNGKSYEIYDGEWRANLKAGLGKGKFDGGTYVGNWENDLPHRQGKHETMNGVVYVGDWQFGKKHGHGKRSTALGDFYDGAWRNNKRHGYGVSYFKNRGTYTGYHRENLNKVMAHLNIIMAIGIKDIGIKVSDRGWEFLPL